MATPAQIIANQQNAQSSTGPRTPEGKARVSQNAIKHGLTSKHLIIREDEQEEFTALQSSLLAELAPEGAIETVTFHDLMHAAWNLHRLRRMEAECDLSDFAAYDRIGRYQARTQRAYYKALKELRSLQTNRVLRRTDLEDAEREVIPTLVCIGDLHKQSQTKNWAPPKPAPPLPATIPGRGPNLNGRMI